MTGVVIVDKPQDWTSHDVVGKLRRIYKTKRVGHGGTLDPLATGVLPVFIGRATRACELLTEAGKEYEAGIRFGLSTDTQDITGSIIEQTGIIPSEKELRNVIPEFTGDILQIPPMYSALKVNGRKLCNIARSGGTVERNPRKITIHSLEILSFENGECRIRVSCSKGTYIRTLIDDIGKRLGCGAVMTSLRRTRAGAYGIDQAVPLDRIISVFENGGDCMEFVSELHLLFADRPAYITDSAGEVKIKNGADFSIDAPDGECRIFSADGEFLALCACKDGTAHTIKSFYEVDGQ